MRVHRQTPEQCAEALRALVHLIRSDGYDVEIQCDEDIVIYDRSNEDLGEARIIL